nr:hypothetical protein [Kribbella steppae]
MAWRRYVPGRSPVIPSYHLAEDEAEHVTVVLVRRTRFPERLLLLDRLDHRRPGRDLLERQRLVQHGDPGAVPEHHPGRDRVLAAGNEPGPVGPDRRIQLEPALLRQQVNAQAHQPFGD